MAEAGEATGLGQMRPGVSKVWELDVSVMIQAVEVRGPEERYAVGLGC